MHSVSVLKMQHGHIWNLQTAVSLPKLLNIHKSWTNVEMAQIPPAKKKLQMEKEDLHKKIRPIRPNLEMPLLSLVKKDVLTVSSFSIPVF